MARMICRALDGGGGPCSGVVYRDGLCRLHSTPPPTTSACLLAARSKDVRAAKHQALAAKLDALRCGARLEVLAGLVEEGRAAVNMTLPACIGFLKSGQLWNVYELVRAREGVTGTKLEKRVQQRLGEWYQPRKAVESLLGFGEDTHYCALNVGGAGLTRYGVCCVRFDLDRTDVEATSFSDDTIASIFDRNGNLLASEDEVFERFADRTELPVIAALRHAAWLERTGASIAPGIERGSLMDLLEDSNCPLEIHVHGAVTLPLVRDVVMRKRENSRLWELTQRQAGSSTPDARTFDAVPYYMELLQLLGDHRIPLVVVE